MSTNQVDLLCVVPLPPFLADQLKGDFLLHDYARAPDRAKLLAEAGPRVRGIVAGGMKGADAALMDALPKLEIISHFSVGFDATDVPAAHARNLIVTHTPDVLTDDVADMAMALILMTPRRIGEAERHARAGKWPSGPIPLGVKVSGKRLGIVGLGRIGSAVAKRAAGFGMDIRYHDIIDKKVAFPLYRDLLDLARNCDILLVSCPGGPETKGLINAAVLDALGPNGFLVNIARGTIVDEPALVKALQEKRIAGAGLDVFFDEPNVPSELLTMDNVVATPHIASGTRETRQAMADLVVANLRAHFAGRPPVTPVPRE